jgi:dipeptidyl-peptidase-4
MSTTPPAPLTIHRIYDAPSIDGYTFSFVGWKPNSSVLTYIRSADDKSKLCSWNAADGTSKVLFDYATLDPKSDGTAKTADPKPKVIRPPWRVKMIRDQSQQVYEWSPDGKWIVLGQACGPLYLLDPASGKTVPLTHTPAGWITDFQFSPDSRWLTFVCAFNIFQVDLLTLATTPLTTEGSEPMRIATPDGTNEMLQGAGHWWSPDSSRIACLVTSESGVFQYPLQNLLVPQATVEPQRYVMPGQPGCHCAIRVLSRQGAVWIDTTPWADWYIASVQWLPDSRALAIQMLSREQNQLVLVLADSVTGRVVPLLSEVSDTWINPCNDIHFFHDGKSFLWSSEKEDSYRRLYLCTPGRAPAKLTSGEEALLATVGVDEKNRTIYYLTSPAPYADLQLKSLRYHDDGRQVAVDAPVTLTTTSGTHIVSMSPDFRYFADQFSTVNEPPRLYVQQVGGAATVIEPNEAGLQNIAVLPQFQFCSIKAANIGNPTDSMPLLGRLIPPVGAEPGKRYPVLVYVYGGPIPDACGLDRVVVNFWQHMPDLWLRALPQRGIGVFSVDNRGANAAPRRHAFEAPIYRRLGEIELQDQLAGVAYLKTLPWVDPNRIGIAGGSFGGFMVLNALLNAPGVFCCGAAFAPVTRWMEYNALYAERYMGPPSSNAAGYSKSSVINHAAGIQAPHELLMIHGTADDDVHFAHSAQMLNEFQKVNKQCQLMAYPGENHTSFFVCGNRPAELFMWMDHFLLGHLLNANASKAAV